MSDSKEGSNMLSGSRALMVSAGAKNAGRHFSMLMITGILCALLIILFIPLLLLYQMGVFSPTVIETQDDFPSGEPVPAGLPSDVEALPVMPPPPIELVPGEVPMSEVYLANCIYYQSSGSITCDTNCQEDANKSAVAAVVDSNNSLALAKESSLPMRLGTITFSPGKVSFTPEHVSIMGELISNSLSELDSDIASWKVSLSCGEPKGSGLALGVSTA